MTLSDLGIVGAGVMGRNLALNFADRDIGVSIHDRNGDLLRTFATDSGGVRCVEDMAAFCAGLAKPRRILLMVTAGEAVDWCIEALTPLLEPEDVIIDGGNSHYRDTARRCAAMEQRGMRYVGMGVSGGESGARRGPSLMPGGSREAWPALEPLFTSIAARLPDGRPCCAFLGPDGAGHFVKMVHNGIEYADMQLIAEAYWLLRRVAGIDAEEQSAIFRGWNEGPLQSYLIEITAEILARRDPETAKPMVDVILDKAGQKGTGKWTSQAALDLGTAAPTIGEAVFARCLSALKDERVAAGNLDDETASDHDLDRDAFVRDVESALYAAKICSYAQGFQLLRDASKEYEWELDYGSIATLWRAGCIIRAGLLERICETFESSTDCPNLIRAPFFAEAIRGAAPAWRRVVALSARSAVPAPAMSSALAYYDGYHSPDSPASLIQAQRDYFGAHRYERVDRPRGETFHTNWEEDQTNA